MSDTARRTEPVDTLHEAIDATMPALADIDPDWQSRWSTAALLLNELEQRGYTLAAQGAADPVGPEPRTRRSRLPSETGDET